MSRTIKVDAFLHNIGRIPQLRGITYTRIKKAVEETESSDNGWISVKDRLPEKNDEYIVAVNDGIQAYSTWDVYHKSHGWLAEDPRVTHWMPFPEPPKEE